MTLRGVARDALYRLLYTLTGPGQGVRAILMYHSIGSDLPFSTPLNVFKRQMQIIRDRFRVVTLKELLKTITSTPADANIACITFDDGYRDNYECALPVLEQFGVKATFFVATGFLGKSFPSSAGQVPVMTESEVRELAKLGHEVGAHTVAHPRLTQVSRVTALGEIENSKYILERMLGAAVLSFAYPKGDVNDAVKDIVGALGFKTAVTVREGLMSGSPDWLALPRVWINPGLSLKGFEAKVSPSVEKYQEIRKAMWLKS